MSIATDITRITNAKAEIKAAIEEKGVSVGEAKIDDFAQKIAQIATGGIEGAACGKFTWDGNYPVSCDCSGMENAPTSIVIFCPDLIYASATTKEAAIIAGKSIGASSTTYFVVVKRDNTIGTAVVHDWIVYDASTSSILIKESTAWELLSGKEYYWAAV